MADTEADRRADIERCRKCGEPIEGSGFGSPEAGYEHPFSCPQNPELCADCKAPSVVGWGTPAVWLCMEHFEEKLAGTRVLFDRAVAWVCEDLDGNEVIAQADYSHEPTAGRGPEGS